MKNKRIRNYRRFIFPNFRHSEYIQSNCKQLKDKGLTVLIKSIFDFIK